MAHYETERLILKTEFEHSWYKILDFYEKNRSHLEPYELTRPSDFYTPTYQLKLLSAEAQLTKSHSYLRLWLYKKEALQDPIGTICFSDIFQHSANLGYKLDKDHLHYGYCYEACQKGLLIMKQEYHLHQILACVAKDNLPSLRLLQRLHFTYHKQESTPVEINHTLQPMLLYKKQLV